MTTDKNLRYQQNLSGRRLAIVVLGNAQWPNVQLCLDQIVRAVLTTPSGGYVEVEIPYRD